MRSVGHSQRRAKTEEIDDKCLLNRLELTGWAGTDDRHEAGQRSVGAECRAVVLRSKGYRLALFMIAIAIAETDIPFAMAAVELFEPLRG
jgi:hypothetical protein